MKRELSSLTQQQRQEASIKACDLLLSSFPPESFAALLSYAPLKTELSPTDVTRSFLQQGKTVALPRVVPSSTASEQQMDFITLDAHIPLEQQTTRGTFGIREPVGGKPFCLEDTPAHSSVLLIAPALAFGRDGSRLGRGGGFYDRKIAELKAQAALCDRRVVVCGFCFALQIKDSVPTESHDAFVDALVSEECVIICHPLPRLL